MAEGLGQWLSNFMIVQQLLPQFPQWHERRSVGDFPSPVWLRHECIERSSHSGKAGLGQR